MNILGIIPARYHSSRFPGKPLIDIAGEKMIDRVYKQAMQSNALTHVIVATDHEAIFHHVTTQGASVVMTSKDHVSGTDRCQEALHLVAPTFDYVINIQGDEPYIFPEQIDLLASMLDGETEIATLVRKIVDTSQVHNHNAVKVVINKNEEAVYFSRSPIPYVSEARAKEWLSDYSYYKHVGLYAYRCDVLNAISKLPMSSLEKAESLEQLRWLENGYSIRVKVTDFESFDINTPADLNQALNASKKG